MACLFSVFFCFVAPTLADYAFLPEEAVHGKPVDTHFNGCWHACRIQNMGSSLCICASFSPSCSMSPLQMMSLITRVRPPLSLCHIFLLSHSQTRHSVKAFKVTYIQPLSFPSHPVGGVAGCLLIWFFPQTITPYLSLWTHLEVILLLISKTTQRNVKAGVWTRRWCLRSARFGRKKGLACRFIMHHCQLPPTPPNTYVPTQAHYSQTGMVWTPEAPQRQRHVGYLTVCLWTRPPSCWPARHFHTTDHLNSPCPSPLHRLPCTAEPWKWAVVNAEDLFCWTVVDCDSTGSNIGERTMIYVRSGNF